MHGLLDAEAAEILALFEEWGETDGSHRKRALTAGDVSGSGPGHWLVVVVGRLEAVPA